MEMNLVDRHAVNLCLGFCQLAEYGEAFRLNAIRQRRRFDNRRDFLQAAVLVMMVMARRIDEMLVAVRTVMFVMMMVLMIVPAVVRMVMTFRIKNYVVIDRLNSQLGNGFADEGISFQLQRSHGVLKGVEGHAGLQKHAGEHIAADAGKTIEV